MDIEKKIAVTGFDDADWPKGNKAWAKRTRRSVKRGSKNKAKRIVKHDEVR